MSGLRERKKQATRIAIRDAAMALFEEHGFAHTTFDRIAETADVSRATVFTYFPTKEEIVFGDAAAAVDALSAMLAGRPETPNGRPETPDATPTGGRDRSDLADWAGYTHHGGW